MATFLDTSLLTYFSSVFPVLLVFAFMFAILQKTKAIGETPAINALVSAVAALLILLAPKAIRIINFMIPWFAVVIIFFILLILVFKIFGLKDESLVAVVTKDGSVYWTLIAICLAIVGAAMGDAFGQEALVAGGTADGGVAIEGSRTTTGGDFQSNVWSIVKNPKILGMIIIFAIAVLAISLLTSG